MLCSHQSPVTSLRYGRVVFPARHEGLSVVNHTQKRALCLGRRYEKMLLTHSFLFRCVSQPPPLRGTSFHRKEGEPCPCIAFPYCHFERKREIFFVSVNKKREGIGKRETRYSIRYFLCSEITAFHLGIKNPPKAVWLFTLSALGGDHISVRARFLCVIIFLYCCLHFPSMCRRRSR